MTTNTNPIVLFSGCFGDAARVWAAAAGTSGAYVPKAIEFLVGHWTPCHDAEDLRYLLERADVVAAALDECRHDMGFRRAELDDASCALVWQTSACLRLEPLAIVVDPDDPDLVIESTWQVTIDRPHPVRMAAAAAKTEALKAEQEAFLASLDVGETGRGEEDAR